MNKDDKNNLRSYIDNGTVFLKNKFFDYNFDNYLIDVKNNGLKNTWFNICDFVLKNDTIENDFFDIDKFANFYEAGLALENKHKKKNNGQYYTPNDVAQVMSNWLYKSSGENICDVGCGTGKLILNYLDLIGTDNTKKLISSGKLYLYEIDEVALKICKTIIAIKYGKELFNYINDFHCDFLDSSVILPENCKVISNPPYAKIDMLSNRWDITNVIKDSKELYSAFMEKIINQSISSVIITPFSFVSGNKFYSLRKLLCTQSSGLIVSFDNVPGNIFNGKKYGIFNSNTMNSVRASITVSSKKELGKGYLISPLIRFKNKERDKILKIDFLESLLPSNGQVISDKNKKFKKIDKDLFLIYEKWISLSSYKFKDFITKEKTDYSIDIPNTCRYFTTASSVKLKRSGSIYNYFSDKEKYIFLYCFINSSFAYWWWRIFDGGITYPVNLLMDLPIPFNLLKNNDIDFFKNLYNEMHINEKKYVIKKVNSGIVQENLKFPVQYRNKINKHLLSMLGIKSDSSIFNKIHANEILI